MPNWKKEIERDLRNLRIEPAREAAIIEELSQHLEDFFEGLLAEGESEAAAYQKTRRELERPELIAQALTPQDRLPKYLPAPEGQAASGHFFSDFARDLRYGLRSLRRNSTFAFFAVVTLALGIGANTTVFTVINTLLLHPLPVNEPSRLVSIFSIESKTTKSAGSLLSLSYLNLKDLIDKPEVFSRAAGFTMPTPMTLGGSAAPQRIFAELITPGYFETLGLSPSLGRFFASREDSVAGSAPVAVLSHSAWQGRFGGSPAIIGSKLQINDAEFTVIGVAPKGFIGVSAIFGPDVWLPATMAQAVLSGDLHDALTDRTKPLFHGVARLNSGTNRSQAQASLFAEAAALAREYPAADKDHTVTVRPVTDEIYSNVGGQSGILFGSIVLSGIVGLVLLIACSNVANLLLARAAARRQEIAVRLSIGASRARLIRQLLTESVLLGLLGGALGLAIGYGACRLVWSFRPAEVANNIISLKLDGNVFLYAFAVSLLTGLIFGAVPALSASKADVIGALKEQTRTAGRSRRSITFGNSLLVGQVALSLVSLITAALFLHSMQRAYQVNPGFQAEHLAVFLMNKGMAAFDRPRTEAFYRDLRDRVQAMPGVAAVSWASNMPFWARAETGVAIEGQDPREKSSTMTTVVNTVDTGYFETMGVPILRGRDFLAADREGSVPAAIINQALANTYWPRGAAIGHRILLAGDNSPRQIIGIAQNANYTTIGEPPQPCVYLPLKQNFADYMTLYVRSKGDASGILTAVQRKIREQYPKIEVSDVRTGAKIISQVLFVPQIGASMLAAFGFLALALASVGLYGIMAYSVNLRQREIGLRIALGAERGEILLLVLRQGLTLISVGLGLGLAAALLISRALSSLLFGVSPADPVSLVSASAVLMTVGIMASYWPARFASRVDPIVALREA